MNVTVYVYRGFASGVLYINIDFPDHDYRAVNWVDAIEHLTLYIDSIKTLRVFYCR